MRAIRETKLSSKQAKATIIDFEIKSYDQVEREGELKKLEELRSRFILMASPGYHYPYRLLNVKTQPLSLISRLINLKALKQGVAGMIKSIIF